MGSGTSSVMPWDFRERLADALPLMRLSYTDWFAEPFGRLDERERVTARFSLGLSFDDDGLAVLVDLPLSIGLVEILNC